MNKIDRGVLYGMVFGDGNLYLPKGQVNYSLTIGHGPNQLTYLEHKTNLLHSIFGGKRPVVSDYSSFNKTTEKFYTNIQVRKTDTYFNQIHKNVYATGKKEYTKQSLNYLTDHGLALWFMDDGSGVVSKNKNGDKCGCMIRMSTYCTHEEALIIQSWFKETYNLSCVFDIDKRNNRYSIRFKTQDSKIFANIVKPYIIPSMMYKIEEVLNYSPRVLDTPCG